MKSQISTMFPVAKRDQVLNGSGGAPIKIDIISASADEVHIMTLVPIRYGWFETDLEAATELALGGALGVKSCSTIAGGEFSRHCRRTRDAGKNLYILADGVAATTFSYELGQYQGVT